MSETASAESVSADTQSSEVEASEASEASESSNEQSESTEAKVVPQPPAKRKYTYKADGQDVEEELDDAEITRRLSLAKAAHKRMSESARTKMQAEALIREFHENPVNLFKKLDANTARTAAEQYLLEHIKNEMMSPEERQRQDMMRRLQAYEEQERQQREESEARQAAELQERYAQDYSNTIAQALAHSGLPKVPATVKRMAELMYKNLELGLDLTPGELVEEVKKSYYSEFKELFGNGDVSFILNMFGDDVANKIRKHDLQKLQSRFQQPVSRVSEITKTETPRRRMPAHEYEQHLRNKIRD